MVSPTAKWTAKSVSNSNGVTTQMAMRKRIAIFHFIGNCNSVDHLGNVPLPDDAIYTRRYMQTDFKLYKVDMKYIRNLHNIDDKVLSVSPQAGKDNRVFIGIVIVCGSHKYCIPLSSPKEKHKNMKNSMDFSKIEVNGKLLGVLNFNLMIPIEEDQLQLVDTTIFKRDRENIRYYKKLCTLELEWCQTNNEVICNKANVLYKKYLSNEPFAGRNRCLNFPKLEAECEKYNLKIKKGTN